MAQHCRQKNAPPRLLKHVIAIRLRQRKRRKLLHWLNVISKKQQEHEAYAAEAKARRRDQAEAKRLLLLLSVRLRPKKLLRGIDSMRRRDDDCYPRSARLRKKLLLCTLIGGSSKVFPSKIKDGEWWA